MDAPPVCFETPLVVPALQKYTTRGLWHFIPRWLLPGVAVQRQIKTERVFAPYVVLRRGIQ
jgi:hypothetical protein